MQQKNGKRIKPIPAKQNGVALLMLMLAILLIVTVGIINIIDPEAKRTRMEQRTQGSLAMAKEALLMYAITSHDSGVLQVFNPGRLALLPCPDRGSPNAEGVQEPSCGNGYASALGKLPWKTLKIGPLKDGSNECMWYAVSGHYKTQPGVPTMTNEDSPAQLLLYASDGMTLLRPNPDTADERLVAAIFAPGPALPGQARNPIPGSPECGGNYNPANYLENAGAASNSNLSGLSSNLDNILQGDALSDDIVNDRVVTISKSEIWTAIQNRNFGNLDINSDLFGVPVPSTVTYEQLFQQFTYELAQCIADFGSRVQPPTNDPNDLRLPWAVPVNSISGAGQWFYANSDNYADQATTYAGRFPFKIDASVGFMTYAGPTTNIFLDGNCAAFLPGHPAYPMYENLWEHWKDHVFYAVSQDFAPDAAVPSVCGANCLSVNGNGQYAAIIIFGGSRNVNAGQLRNGPPGLPGLPPGTDDKQFTINYLSPNNRDGIDDPLTNTDFEIDPGNVNDILMCVAVNPLDTTELIVDVDCIP